MSSLQYHDSRDPNTVSLTFWDFPEGPGHATWTKLGFGADLSETAAFSAVDQILDEKLSSRYDSGYKPFPGLPEKFGLEIRRTNQWMKHSTSTVIPNTVDWHRATRARLMDFKPGMKRHFPLIIERLHGDGSVSLTRGSPWGAYNELSALTNLGGIGEWYDIVASRVWRTYDEREKTLKILIDEYPDMEDELRRKMPHDNRSATSYIVA